MSLRDRTQGLPAMIRGEIDETEISPDMMMSVYNKWSPAKNLVSYTVGFPFEKDPGNLPGEFVTLEIPDVSTFTSQITGPDRHIGLWVSCEVATELSSKAAK